MKNKIVDVLLFVLDWTWCLPQTLLGLILVKITKAERQVFRRLYAKPIVWYRFERDTEFKKFISGVSLASYILLPSDSDTDTIKHEHGHSIQSKMWGWLYLPVIGVYSAVFCNLWDRLFHKDWCYYDRHYWYYVVKYYFEGQADKFGGVARGRVLANIKRPGDAKYPAVGV